MDLLDLAILALRIALVAVVYVFLLVVLRSAGRALQAARPGPRATAWSGNFELRLVVLEPGGSGLTAGQVIAVQDGATLGRAGHAEVVVADATVSAEHARVSRVGPAWVVLDLGSTNGTLINDVPLPLQGQTPLTDGDVLALGGVRLKVALHAAAAEQPR